MGPRYVNGHLKDGRVCVKATVGKCNIDNDSGVRRLLSTHSSVKVNVWTVRHKLRHESKHMLGLFSQFWQRACSARRGYGWGDAIRMVSIISVRPEQGP